MLYDTVTIPLTSTKRLIDVGRYFLPILSLLISLLAGEASAFLRATEVAPTLILATVRW
jgi:hypothetical protein